MLLRRWSWFVLLALSGTPVAAQTSAGIARSVNWGSALPATCAPAGIPNVFFKTTATVGVYACTATNTWTLISGGGGGGSSPGAPDGSLQYRVDGTTLGGAPMNFLSARAESVYYPDNTPGLDDCVVDTAGFTDVATNAGGYLYVQATTLGTPDQFTWVYQNGATAATIATGTVNLTGAVQTLTAGITLQCTATTGHTLNDIWRGATGFLYFPSGSPFAFPQAPNTGPQSKLGGVLGNDLNGYPTLASVQGQGFQVVGTDGTFTSGNIPKYDANGALTDSGFAPGAVAPAGPDGSLQYRVDGTTLGGVPSMFYRPANISGNTPKFTGSGLNDCTFNAGVDFTGDPSTSIINVVMTTAGTPDLYEVSSNNGVQASNVALTGSPTEVWPGAGTTFTCSATTGHTAGDLFQTFVGSLSLPPNTVLSDTIGYPIVSTLGVDANGNFELSGFAPGPSPVQSVTVGPITAAQIKDLTANPVEIVPTQGANKVIVVNRAYIEYVAGTQVFACGADNFTLRQNSIDQWASNGDIGGAAAMNFPTPIIYFGLIQAVYLATADGTDAALKLYLPNNSCYRGAIGTNAVNSGGAMYSNGDTGEIDGACYVSGAKSTYTVLTNAAGAVATYSVTDNGGVYTTGTGCTTTATSGTGSGLTIDVSAVTPPGDGSLYVTVQYSVLTVH